MDLKKAKDSKNVTDLRGGNSYDILRHAMDSEKKKKEFLKVHPDYEKNEAAYNNRVKKDRDLVRNKDVREPTPVKDWGNAGSHGNPAGSSNRKRNPNDPMPGKFTKNKNGDSDFLPFKTIK